MTQEEKARAYDEAVKIARCWLNDPQTIQDCNYTIEDAIQNIFPQLRESEDERTRKELVEKITNLACGCFISQEQKQKFIAYLEKQKEQKPMKWSEEDEKIRKQLINICNEWLGGGYSARPCLNDIRWLKNLLEKQKEPKHAPDDLQKSFEAGQTSIVDNPEQYGLCKKAEWSEEDESELTAVICCVSRAIKASKDENERNSLLSAKKWLQDKLSFRVKFLRPSWKPSEEQMNALNFTITYILSTNANPIVLRDLYNDLLKLK